MQFKSTQIASILLIVLTLTACGSFRTVANTPNLEDSPTAATPPVYRAQVVEILVSEADGRGNQAIPEGAATEDGDSTVQPLTPTVAMTANRIVERTINDYLQNRRSMLRMWISRSQTYFPMIEKIFAQEEVPDELKYIALGESSLNPTIRSTAGAVGMWQFMSATARSEGLRVDSWVDERRDPEKSTRAAARHLKALNESYSGSWHLSLAGYNCSYRCITRAVEQAGGSLVDPPSYWDIYPNLPRETREFVPRYIAAALIVSNPSMYGIEVDNFDQELAYDEVSIYGMLSLEDAARLAGTDLPTIHNLNPSLLKATLPEGSEAYTLKIPFGSYDHFITSFDLEMPSGFAGTGEYIVNSGDTLGKIAQQFDVSVEELQTANNISSHLIQINQKLLVPGMGGTSSVSIASTERTFVSYGDRQYRPIELGPEFRLVHQSGSTAETPLMAVSLERAAADEGVLNLVPTIYKVQTGDTLGAISQRYGVSVASIQQANNIRGTAIFANQELTIHSAARTLQKPVTPVENKTYQVQRGDNLSGIATRFGVSVDNLKRWNSLRNNLIYPGQSLVLN